MGSSAALMTFTCRDQLMAVCNFMFFKVAFFFPRCCWMGVLGSIEAALELGSRGALLSPCNNVYKSCYLGPGLVLE